MTRAYNTATTQQNSGGAVAGVTAGKNAIINGGMDIWQRGTSFSSQAALGAPAYSADRMHFYRAAGASGATLTRQSSGLTGIQYCARLQRNSGETSLGSTVLRHTLESADSYRFAGQTVTLSYYARAGANYSSASNAWNVTLASGTGVDQPVYSFTGFTTVASHSIPLTTSWQRFTLTGTVASNATQIGIESFYVPVGTAGANDYMEITGIQLEVGSVATPFSRAGGTIQGELSACQRYLPAIRASASDIAIGQVYTTTQAIVPFLFPVTPRVAPTGITVSAVASFYLRNSAASYVDCTAIAFQNGGPSGGSLVATVASGLTAGNSTTFFGNSPGLILFTGCEL